MDSMQFAFVPGIGKGTVCALALMQHRILEFLDRGSGAVRMLLIDLTKAFDKAQPSVIVSALQRLGAPCEAIFWIYNYLTNRKQAVRLLSTISSWVDVISGVPQGSVLGPFLFAAIIDSLCPLHTNSLMIKYADDVTLLHFVRSPEEDRLAEEWENASSWCSNHQLIPNTSKTALMDFCTAGSLVLSDVMCADGSLISRVTSAKVLGVTISNDFSWNLNIDSSIAKASQRLYAIKALRSLGIPGPQLWTIYRAFIESILLYAFPAWCNTTQSSFKKLEKVSKRVQCLIGSPPPVSLLFSAKEMCINLTNKITAHPDHPLRTLYVKKNLTNTRRKRLFFPCTARTKRFKNSLTRFFK
jgi:hypothetical protein